MTGVAYLAGAAFLVVAALVRAGAAALAQLPRAEALHAAAEGVTGAATAAALLERADRVRSAVGLVQTALLVLATGFGAVALAGGTSGWPLILGLLALVALVVLVGLVLPGLAGARRPRWFAYRLAPVLRLAAVMGRPAVTAPASPPENGVAEVEDEDDTAEQELEMITSVIAFGDAVVREVMVPRADMVMIGRDATTDDLMDLLVEHGFSRVPVIGDDPDDVVGICYAKDLLAMIDRGELAAPVSTVMRPADFVPENKRVAELLREMQATKSHMAIVVDEFGGTAGLVTLEDLLEELVGEIVDEYDVEVPLVEVEEDGGWRVDGRLPVADLSELVGVEFPDDEWDTVGGLVLGLAGRVPEEGEMLTSAGTTFTPLRVQGRRVAQVRVQRLDGGGRQAPDMAS
ncbi:MAG TPA: hemolysin family protein [Acidimicrobiia bacterium]|nr:hemolysin family protein [Acidimicrobiia bacterium]